MDTIKKEGNFYSGITDKTIAEQVSVALRHEHAGVNGALKQIERVTGLRRIMIRNWYNGKYAPKFRHLLILGKHYPMVLQLVCEWMGMDFVWQHAVRMRVPEAMRARLEKEWKNWKKSSTERDKFVLIRVRLDAHKAVQLNQRQLWFLGQMQQGYVMHAGNLVDTWHIHAKTAGRDIKGLLKAELIQPMKHCRPHCYEPL